MIGESLYLGIRKLHVHICEQDYRILLRKDKWELVRMLNSPDSILLEEDVRLAMAKLKHTHGSPFPPNLEIMYMYEPLWCSCNEVIVCVCVCV